MTAESPPATWFRRAIALGLARLLALALPGAPADETAAAACRESWVDALWAGRVWIEAEDAPRIERAFRALALRAERWPAPHHLLQVLPRRDLGARLPEPVASAEGRRRALDLIARIAARYRQSHD